MAHLLHTSFIPANPASLRRSSSLTHFTSPRSRTRFVPRANIREIFIPALSSTMTEGKIVSWVKSEGEKLSKGESVVVVESDKADMVVESFYDGYLSTIIVDEGNTAPVGSAVALLVESEEEIALALEQAQSKGSAVSSAARKGDGDSESGNKSENIGAVAVESKTTVVEEVAVRPAASAVHPRSEGGKRVVASPYAKKLAKELGVDLRGVVGSGPNGRIVAKDVEAASTAVVTAIAGGFEVAVKDKVSGGVQLGSVVPFTTMQNAVSRNMVETLAVPTFRVGYTITTDALDALYKKIKSKGVTMTALLAKATALALVQHPVVNSSCRDGKSFTYNSSINTAVAVATDGGLISPVLQDVDKVDIYSLSRKWKELVAKAWAKQLQLQEYSTEFSSHLLVEEDEALLGRRSDCISGLCSGAIFWLASAQFALAIEDARINEVYEMGELFELGIQLTYLLLLLALLGIGSFFVIRQVLVRRELDLSAKELQEQVRSGDASATELFELGAVMLRRKFYPAATKYLLQAIEKWDGDDQDLAQVYNALGVSYIRDEKVEKGIAQFEKAVKLQPGYVTAWNNLGDAYEKKNDFKSALKAFEEALLFDPNNKIARPRRDVVKNKVKLYKGVPVKSKKS